MHHLHYRLLLGLLLGGSVPEVMIWSTNSASTLVLAQTVEQQKAEANRLLQDGVNDYNDQVFNTALQSVQKALAIYRAIQDRNGEANALLHLGMVNGLDDNTIDYYNKSVALFIQLNDRAGQAKVLVELGNFYIKTEKYNKAVPYLEQVLLIFRQLKDRDNEEATLASLSIAHMFLSQKDRADFYFIELDKLQRIARQPNSSMSSQATEPETKISQRNTEGDSLRHEEAKRLLERGIQQYNDENSLDGGSKSWERALNIYRTVQDDRSEAQLLINIGNACDSLSSCRNSFYYYETAILIFKKLNDRDGEAKALFNLASTYVPKGSAGIIRHISRKSNLFISASTFYFSATQRSEIRSSSATRLRTFVCLSI
jgi:tetratricopeptide (TPR) repeat protein